MEDFLEEPVENGKKAHTSWKLTEAQKEQVVEWIAVFPSNREVLTLMRRYGYPEVASESLTYYRQKYGEKVEELTKRFREKALERGWAIKEARVQLLDSMLSDWSSREPDGKEVSEMALKIEKQLSERVDEPSLQKVQLSFDEPQLMKDLVGD